MSSDFTGTCPGPAKGEDWAVGQPRPSEHGCAHIRHPNMKDHSLLIDGAGCAVVDVQEDGTVVYDLGKLISHFAEHEDMRNDEDEDSLEMACEWVFYNVIRGLEYYSHDEAILPRVLDELGDEIFPGPTNDDEDAELEADADKDNED